MSFAVRVTFVDNTYLDDGLRWTSRWQTFESIGECIEFKNAIVGCGKYEATSRVTRETATFAVEEDDVSIFRVVANGMKLLLNDKDVVSMLGYTVATLPTCGRCGCALCKGCSR